MIFLNKFTVLTILIVMLTACASIVGEVDPTKEISLEGTGKALVFADSDNTHVSALTRGKNNHDFITRLDGKGLHRLGGRADFPEALLVEPGRHNISVMYQYYQLTANADLWFDAQAEKSYIIRSKTSGMTIYFWIEDQATGQKVGGIQEKK